MAPAPDLPEPTALEAANPYTERIRLAWSKTTEAVLETGRLLNEAKKALPHGSFTAMVEKDLPFSPRWAQMLMKISADKRILKANQGSLLPASVKVLYHLTRLDDEGWAYLEAENRIQPDLDEDEVGSVPIQLLVRRRQAETKASPPRIPVDLGSWQAQQRAAKTSKKADSVSLSTFNRRYQEALEAVAKAEQILPKVLFGAEHVSAYARKYAELGKRCQELSKSIGRKKTS
ncbi:MAG: DUF3102 domain-containing protein [Acidobacteria bacterium]|jgi:hypothetical protein|nr:DUF3102 domain-containing protein [Acidobacteriota bacterium]